MKYKFLPFLSHFVICVFGLSLPTQVYSIIRRTEMLLDGGLSTALEELGSDLKTSLWSGELLKSSPNQIRLAHEAYESAGAKILISSSYQISYPGCNARGWTDAEVDNALQLSTQLARFENTKVAASIGPYGAYLANGAEFCGNYGLSIDELKDFHRKRLDVLMSTNPDFLAIETIPELTEARAIIELIEERSDSIIIPYWVSFSCKDGCHLNSGENFADAVKLVEEIAKNAIAVGVNCTNPAYITSLLSCAQCALPFIVYPNAGGTWNAETKELEGAVKGFTEQQIQQWRERGASIIGGCCGIGPKEIAAIANSICAPCKEK